MTTKSGTNSLHGTAYEFFRNNHLDSRGFFSQTTLPPFTRNQYGTSLGGPIQKSKTFFFITYEGLGSKQASITKTTVPTALERSGNFSESTTPITINGTKTFQIPQALISSVSQEFLQYWPLPTTGGLTNNYIRRPSARSRPTSSQAAWIGRSVLRTTCSSRTSFTTATASTPARYRASAPLYPRARRRFHSPTITSSRLR